MASINETVRQLVRYRAIYCVVTLILTIMALVPLREMELDGDINAMIDSNNRYMAEQHRLDTIFHKSQYILFLVQPRDRNVLSVSSLALLRSLTTQASLIPYSQNAESITSFPYIEATDDELSVGDVIDDESPITSATVEKITDIIAKHPNLKGRLISTDMTTAVVLVSILLPDNEATSIAHVMQTARQLKQAMVLENPGTDVIIGGDIALQSAMLEVTEDDMERVIPAVLLAIFILTGVFLRSMSAVLAALTVVVCSCCIAMGLMAELGFRIDPVTMMAPAIIMILAVVDSIHILTQYLIALHKGQTPKTAMIHSLSENARPVFWTSVTTAIGFLGMNFGDSPSFRALGNMASCGVLCAFLCTYTILPTIVLLRPARQPKLPVMFPRLLQSIAYWSAKPSMSAVVGVLLVSGYFLWQVPKLEFNDDLTAYFDDTLEIHHAMQATKRYLRGTEYINIAIDSAGPDGINDPAFLSKVDQFSLWLREQPETADVTSYTDLIKTINKVLNGNDPGFYRIPDNRELISQYLLLYEIASPTTTELNRQISNDRSSILVTINLRTHDNKSIIGLEQRATAWLASHMAYESGTPTSQLLIFTHLGDDIIQSMIDGSYATFILISGMMIFSMRSWRYGLFAMIPNLCPPAIVYGAWSLLIGEMNQAAAMAFSVSLGLVVDDTVHIMSKYLEYRRNGVSPQDALANTLLSSGTAVIITSLTLITGILLLSLSHFTLNDTMSLLLSSIILIALLFDILVLPRMLYLGDRLINR